MSLLYKNTPIIKAENINIKGKMLLNVNSSVNTNTNEQEYNTFNEQQEDLLKLQQELDLKMEQSQKECEEIISKAKEEANNIIQESKNKAADIEKDAYNEGYEQGSKNGYEDGYKEAFEDNIEKAKQEANTIIESANKILLESNKQVASYMKENKASILNLSISIAEKVLRRSFEDNESMNEIIMEVIREYELKENFIIKLNSIYKESIDEKILQLKETHTINSDVFVIADDSIENGNAIIEKENGRIVVGIDAVLDKIKEELL